MALDETKIRGICDRVAASLGLAVVEVEFRGGGKSRLLRIFIDRLVGGHSMASAGDHIFEGLGVPLAEGGDIGGRSGVSHEDCARMSHEVGTILDVEDAIPGGAYTLEVSSPGLDRKLNGSADFERFAGNRIKVMTREPIAGNRHFQGRLEKFGEGKIVLDLSAAKKKNSGLSRKKQKASPDAPADVGKLEIELANIEKARLAPEF